MDDKDDKKDEKKPSNNYPPAFLDWLAGVADVKEKAKVRLIPGLKMARQGIEEDVLPWAYLLYRDLDNTTIASFIRLELKDSLKKHANEARACYEYTVEAILEPQDRRTAMNLNTEAQSVLEYLEHLHKNVDGWEPFDLDAPHVVDKIKSYENYDEHGNPKGVAIYNITRRWNIDKGSDFFKDKREKDAETDRADAAEAKLADTTMKEIRRRRLETEKAQARARRVPEQIKRAEQFIKVLSPLTPDTPPTEEVQWAFRVPNSGWFVCGDTLNEHQSESLMIYRTPRSR